LAVALAQMVCSKPFYTEAELRILLNREFPQTLLHELVRKGTIIEIAGSFIHQETLVYIRNDIQMMLDAYHSEHPLDEGCKKSEMLARLDAAIGMQQKHAECLIQLLVDQGALDCNKNQYALPGFNPSGDRRHDEANAKLSETIAISGFKMPTIDELTGNDKIRKQVLSLLLRTQCMLVGRQFVLDRRLYEQAKHIALELQQQTGMVKLADFRTQISTSRKFALAILEQFDSEGYTQRSGENRVVLKGMATNTGASST